MNQSSPARPSVFRRCSSIPRSLRSSRNEIVTSSQLSLDNKWTTPVQRIIAIIATALEVMPTIGNDGNNNNNNNNNNSVFEVF